MQAKELLELTSEQLLFRMDEIRNELTNMSVVWAFKKSYHSAKKELLASVLATIQIEFVNDGVSYNEAKIRALASKTYTDAVSEMAEAEKEAEEIGARYKSLMKSLECLQSIAFLKNNELKVLRG